MERPPATGYRVSTDPADVDLDLLHPEIAASYWSPGIPRETLERAIAGSLPFTLLDLDGVLAGFARVVTDGAIFAHLADVIVLPAHRGRGLGVLLVETIMADERLQGLRRFQLHTADAHELYARFGFAPPHAPSTYLSIERTAAELYGR